ncbi:MAG TPA: DUF1302 domain-containing protein [Burkholderiaceae bacterium]|nr:DUF1302 domain-containing protein [Burkholderiaceae bacterium]
MSKNTANGDEPMNRVAIARRRPAGGRPKAALAGGAVDRLAVLSAAVLLSALPDAASAGDFSLGNGIEGRWGLGTSLGSSWRMRDADPALLMVGNGGLSGSSHDDGNLNFDKGDDFSTIARLTAELELKRGGLGVFLRGKAWYDYRLEEGTVPHGSSANGYVANTKLRDDDFHHLSKFSGADVVDAYASWGGDIGDRPLSVKLGKHVVNWGESLFVPGINQYNAIDVSAARRPGTEVKEILLGVPQLSASMGVTDDLSVEAFYQFRWARNVLDGCGTYWSISDVYNCSNRGVAIGAGPFAALPDSRLFNSPGGYTGLPPSVTNFVLTNGGERTAEDSGQFGVAARYFARGLGAEFGLYFVNYHQRSPIISVLFNSSAAGSAFSLGNNRLQYVWDWSAEDIKVFGLSASTTLAGWSVFGEVSHTKDFPVQLNGLDLLRGAANGAGPLAFLQATPRDQGIFFSGYERKDKTQVQASVLKIFPRIAGAESATLVGEVAYQNWSGIGDPNTSRRYGRAFVFGQAQTSTLPCTAPAGSPSTGNANSSYCENEGFATSTAWGYRARLEFSYPNLFAGVNVRPRIFWSHDVKGYSADAAFVEDRMALGLGVRFDYLSRYYADISYNRFNRDAKYDIFHDRDFASLVVGANF